MLFLRREGLRGRGLGEGCSGDGRFGGNSLYKDLEPSMSCFCHKL